MTVYYNTLGNLLPAKNLFTVTTTYAFTTANTGSTLNCTGASPYVLTISPGNFSPSISAVGFQSNTTSNAVVTLTPGSGTLQGQSSVAIGTGDCGVIRTDATFTNLYFDNIQMQPCNIRYYQNAVQAIATATATKVKFDTAVYDVGGFYDAATNYRWTPKLPGKYSISALISLNPTLIGVASFTLSVYLNGAANTSVDVDLSAAVTGTPNSISVGTTIKMNGTTDYIEIFLTQNTGVSMNIGGDATRFVLIGSRDGLF